MKDYRILVEVQPTGVPKPVCFGVFADNLSVAFLTETQVRKALVEFDRMKLAWETQERK